MITYLSKMIIKISINHFIIQKRFGVKKLLSRNIFFPIEIIKRDLDYKMFLACLVLEKNQEAIIAQHDRIEKIMLKSNNGIYIGKNIMNKPDKLIMIDILSIIK